MAVKKNRQVKVKYLEGHYWATYNLQLLQKQVEKKEGELYSPKSPKYSNMPKGGEGKSTEDKILDKAELEKRIDQCQEKREEIERTIRGVQNQQYVLLLQLKYVDHLKLYMVAEKMSISYSRASALHGLALDMLPIPV